MSRQTIMALGIAVLLGIVAVILANSFLNRTEERNAANAMTKVAVAAVPLGYGVDITPDKIRFADYPVSSLPPGSFRSMGELMPGGQKRVALLPIAVNEPILESKLSGAGKNASIAALLPEGKRAASVRINDVSGVAGFVQPNDAVDVLVTRRMVGAGGDQQLTDVLLQNVRVIAIGQNAKTTDGKPEVAKSATLEVDPLGAQKLALAQEVGSLSLVLRKPGDAQSDAFVSTVSLEDLRANRFGSSVSAQPPKVTLGAPARPRVTRAAPRPVRRTPPPPPPPPPPKPTVEIVRGTQGNDYEVGGNGA